MGKCKNCHIREGVYQIDMVNFHGKVCYFCFKSRGLILPDG